MNLFWSLLERNGVNVRASMQRKYRQSILAQFEWTILLFFEYQLIVFIFFVEVTLMNKLIPQFVDMNWTCVKDSNPRLGKLGCVDVDEKVVAWKIPLVLRAVLKKHKLQSRSCQFLCLHGF